MPPGNKETKRQASFKTSNELTSDAHAPDRPFRLDQMFTNANAGPWSGLAGVKLPKSNPSATILQFHIPNEPIPPDR